MTEHEIQIQCVNWYRSNFPNGIIFAVPNQGRRSAVQMNYFIQEGFVSGAPDIVAMNFLGKIIFIELKTETGRQSKYQVEFQEKCDYIDEDLYFIARSLEDFKNIIYYDGKES